MCAGLVPGLELALELDQLAVDANVRKKVEAYKSGLERDVLNKVQRLKDDGWKNEFD